MGQGQSGMRCYVRNTPQDAQHGWQRKCLFGVLLGLILLIIINFAVTLWLIKVLEFNVAGFEGLKILSGGLQLPGNAFVFGSLISSNIHSLEHQMLIGSSHNFTVDTRDHLGHITNSLFIDEHKVQSHAAVFAVSDSKGQNVFSVNKHEVMTGAETVKLSGAAGSVVHGSVQTNKVVSGIGTDLRLETSNTKLYMNAPTGVRIESLAGDIRASAQENIKLESFDGGIRLEASDVFLPGLKIEHASVHHSSHKPASRIFQLCVCNNGKLFLAPANGHCVVNTINSECR